MKLLATILIALWSLPSFSFSLNEFAAKETAGKPGGFIHWHGHGTMVAAPSGKQDPFLVSLTMRNLGNHAILFQYRVAFENSEYHKHFVAQVEDNGFFTIYVPAKICGSAMDNDGVSPRCRAVADEEVVNLEGYNKSGWGYSVGNSMYFSYRTASGHHGTHHYRSYHDEHGNFRLAATGSMGTESDGLKFTWTEDVKRVFVHRPH